MVWYKKLGYGMAEKAGDLSLGEYLRTMAIMKNPERPVRRWGGGDRGRVPCELWPCF